MSVNGISECYRVGNDLRFAVRFGLVRWRRWIPYGGKRHPHICPFCGCIAPDKTARAAHEAQEAKLQIAFRLLGLEEHAQVQVTDLQADTRAAVQDQVSAALAAAGVQRPPLEAAG